MTEMSSNREHRLAQVFVSLADTLVTDFDVADLFHDLAASWVELLEVTAAGLMLVDVNGRLRVMASSSERSRLLELMEIQDDEGPCLDCHRDGTPVLVPDLAADRARWPSFTDEALRVEFGAVYALPMRLRQDTIGALNLFHRHRQTITEDTLRLAQALADVATIAILQQRAVQGSADLSQQLQTALNSRVIIEQAKGRRPDNATSTCPPHSPCYARPPDAPTNACPTSPEPSSPANWTPTSYRRQRAPRQRRLPDPRKRSEIPAI